MCVCAIITMGEEEKSRTPMLNLLSLMHYPLFPVIHFPLRHVSAQLVTARITRRLDVI